VSHLNIVFIITRGDDIGGAQIHVRDLAQALQESGHKVTVLCGGSGAFTEMLENRDIPYRALKHLVHPIHPYRDVLAFLEIRRTLEELNPELVCTHSSKAGILGRLAAHRLSLPVTFTAHGWAFTEGIRPKKRMIYRAIERWAARLTHKIITVSEYDRMLAIREKVGRADQIVTIHNGMLDVSQDLRAIPERDPVKLIMVARFGHQKQHTLLLNALSELKTEQWTLDFVGDGPLLGDVRHQVKDLGLEDRVSFLGRRDDVPDRLASSNIFILTSRWEGFPLSIVEAMRAGLPVIASDVGGVREAVVHGETGFLVKGADVNELAGYLKKLITSPMLRRSMGQAGRERYERYFTFDHMYQKTLDIYKELVQKKDS